MIDFDEQCFASMHTNTNLTKLQHEIQELQTKMADNIAHIQSNIEKEEELLQKSDELVEMSKLFKKQTSKLPQSFWQRRGKTILAAGLGAGGGAVIGFGIGGPGAAAMLATEKAEVAVGAVVGASALGASVALGPKISFWDRKFVHYEHRS